MFAPYHLLIQIEIQFPFSDVAEPTPLKVKFERVQQKSVICFVCSKEQQSNLRNFYNPSIQNDYAKLLKTGLLIDIPVNSPLKICTGCGTFLKKVSSIHDSATLVMT
jgi:hypothetical protein